MCKILYGGQQLTKVVKRCDKFVKYTREEQCATCYKSIA